MGGPTEHIFGGTTQLKPLFTSGQRLWVGAYLENRVRTYTCFWKRRFFYAEISITLKCIKIVGIYSWGFIRDPIIGGFTTLPCRHLKSGPIVHLRKIPRSAERKYRFFVSTIHQNAWFQVWIFKKFLGRGSPSPLPRPPRSIAGFAFDSRALCVLGSGCALNSPLQHV